MKLLSENPICLNTKCKTYNSELCNNCDLFNTKEMLDCDLVILKDKSKWRKEMKYRDLKAGEIIKINDEYVTTLRKEKIYLKVPGYTIGQKLFECNTGYYRRPLLKGIKK